jgi:hypothetical protein
VTGGRAAHWAVGLRAALDEAAIEPGEGTQRRNELAWLVGRFRGDSVLHVHEPKTPV